MRLPGDMPRPAPRGPRAQQGGSRLRFFALAALVGFFVLLTSLRGIAGFYTDLLWFDSLGFKGVFTGVLRAKVVLAAIFSVGFFAVLWLNLFIADRLAPQFRPAGPEEEVIERYQQIIGNRTGMVRLGVSALLGLIAGLGVSGQWRNWLLFTNAQDFGVKDAQFDMDVGFFVFRLPFLTFLVDWGFASVTIILIVTAVAHYLNGGIRVQGIGQRVTPQVKGHLSVLLALLAGIRAVGYWLARYELDFSERGAVRGATYTDIKAQLPALRLLLLISIIAVVLFLVNIRRRGWVLPVLAVGLWALVAVAVGTIYPAFVQRFQVEPSEASKERPYIARNIEATRQALNMTEVTAEPFAADGDLSASDLQANQGTIGNIRLWDPNRLVDSFQRLQERQDYYRIDDVDVDRYVIDGELTQVMLSARNLDTGEVPQKSWLARHLTYTHGYGAVAVPANSKDANGRPEFLLSDVPAVSDVPSLELTVPQIYIGEGLGAYVVVGTEGDEIDYQAEDKTEKNRYDGKDGIGISNYLRRAAFALRFGDMNPLISGNVGSKSKILIKRDVSDRVEALAPFLSFDSDPYPVILDGRMKWVVDAYTTTTRYPYASIAETDNLRPGSGLRHSFNYVRNSVKAVIDAYDGDVTFYAVDDSDPLLKAYRQAFPELFTSGDDVPDELRAHFRYPEDLFRVQTGMWARYHIDDPDDFYNLVDAWNIAQDPGTGSGTAVSQAVDAQGNAVGRAREVPIEPYYLLMKAPGDEEETFQLFLPFVPLSGDDSRKELTAFMVAKSDPGSYGKLQVFTMPRGNLPDGPGIVAADMSSEPEVSQLQTLLGQKGSNLLYGNLITVPVEQSLLYVRPIYVEAESTKVPELERVIVAFEGRVIVRNTLREALEEMFPGASLDTGETDTPVDEEEQQATDDEDSIIELLERAATAFDEADVALKEGDLGTYKRKVDEGRRLVEQARQRSSPTSTTTTTRPAA